MASLEHPVHGVQASNKEKQGRDEDEENATRPVSSYIQLEGGKKAKGNPIRIIHKEHPLSSKNSHDKKRALVMKNHK
jgi:hypothetical protein